MAPSPNNGVIVQAPSFYISNPRFEYKANSNNTNYYSLKLNLYDPEYKRCQHAVGGNPVVNATHAYSEVYFQYQYQLPNYVVKVFKKNNTGSTSRNESCWQPVQNFNSTPHLKINSGGTTQNIPSFGVGITPYAFYFQANSVSFDNNGHPIHNYTYSKIGEYNAFDSNDVAYYEFDASGGFTDYSTNHSQVVRDRATGNLGGGGNSQFGYRIKNAQSLSYNTSDLFHEPGIYLVTVMRNAIHNNHINGHYTNPIRYNPTFYYIRDTDCFIRLNAATSKVSQTYLRIDPPSPSITYNPSNDIVSFTFNGYGSVNYNPYNANQRWVMSNQYFGRDNFVAGIVNGTELFPYNLSSNVPSGTYLLSSVNYITSYSDAANSYMTAETTLNNLRLHVNSFNNEIYAKGAFQYDFRLSSDGNADSAFFPYADSANTQYTNFSTAYPSDNAYWWNFCFHPQYNDWNNSIGKNYRTRNETINKNLEIYTVYANQLNFSGAIPDSITFNSEFVNVNNEYILRSYWTENNANFLTNYLVGSEYTLRLYYKVTNSNSDNVAKKYTDGALINYNYVNNSDTGLNLSASQFNSNNRNVYTDKNGTIFYNNAPTNNSSFVGWSEDETKGAILTILQINYTNGTSAGNGVPYLKNYGSYIIDISQHRLSYNINSNTGGLEEIYISQPINSYTPLYADSFYLWNLFRQSTGTNYAIPSSSNDSSPSIEEINNQYIDTTFSNVRFTMSSSSNAINGYYYVDNLHYYGPIFQKVFYPPFYDPNNTNNVVYSLPGKQYYTNSSTILDLTQRIQIQLIGSTFYLYVANVYDSKGSLNSAFQDSSSISLNYSKNDMRYVMLPFYMENYYKAHNTGNIFPNGYIISPSVTPEVIINGPFYDLQYNQVTTYEGIDTNRNTVTLDLSNSAIKLDKETNNNRYLVRVSQQGSAANAYDGSFRNNTSVKLLTDLRFSFTMQNSFDHFAAIYGFAIVDNFTFNGTSVIYVEPPFYNIDGSIATDASGIKKIYTPYLQYQYPSIDLTKKIRISKDGSSYYLYATSIGQSGDTFDATIFSNNQSNNGFKYEYIRSRRRFDYAQVQSNNKTGTFGNTIVNYLDIGPTFTETLGSYGNFNTTSFSNRPNPHSLVYANNNVFTFPYNSDNYFDTSLVKIGSEYLFHSTWIEPHQNKLTSNKINTPYTLRLYNKNPSITSGNVNETYIKGPIENYDFSAIKLEFTMQQAISKVSGNVKINNVEYPPSYFSQDRIFNPPFYDQNNNLITQTLGYTLWGNLIYLDLTKPIKFNNGGTGNTIFVFGTQVGITGNSYFASFNIGSFVSISSDKTYGLNISDNWKTTSPNYTMEVYTDKSGNIFYNNPPANDTQFVGWSESEISGARLMVLQRNYTPTTSDPLYSVTNGAYSINMSFSDPSINYTSNNNNITPSQFNTKNTILYPDAINNWIITRFSDNVNYSLSSIATNNFTPTISEIDAAYSVSIDKAGALTNQINNRFNVGNQFTEDLFFDGSLSTYHFNNENETNITITSNPILIFPDNSENYFDSSLVQIGSEYLFHSTWTELYPTYITSHIVNAPYTLRIYNKDPLNTSSSVNDTYTTGTITNYKYNSTNDFGLNISANWKTTSPSYNTMDVYTDKNGTIFYNNPPANDTQFVGWTYNDISGSKIVTLQRNYTLTTNDPLYLTTNSSYSVQITDPSLVRLNDNDGFMTQLETRNTIIYSDASNQWSVYEYDTTNTISIPNSQLNIPNPTRSQINSAYPLRVGPGSIKNTITNKFDVGNTFVENLGVYGNINNSSINNKEQTAVQYVSNNVNIYDTRQTNDSAYNLQNINYTYLLYDTSKVYFDIDFLDPSSLLLRPEAYDINIFKKTQGTGTAISQWYPNGQYSPYIYQSESNRGITIPNTNVPTQLDKYKIDASGQVFSYGQSVNFNGSFETGGYFVVFRRNFYKGTATEPNAKEPFYTLNSQYVYVSPNQENTPNYNLLIYDSSNLLLEDNSQTNEESLNVNTPIYGSYNADGSNIDIDFTFYINFENELFTPKWQTSNLVDTSNNEAFVNVRDLYIDYFGLGDGVFLMDVSYNWSAPSLLSLPIGEIGGIYPTINEAVFNPSLPGYQLTYPENRIVKPNMGVTNSVLLNLPTDSSYARLNEVKELQAEFIGSDTTRMLAIKWREPDITNLDTTYTGYPYALRLYKKSAIGQTENEQWYPRDNSGTAGIYPYRWTPDYYANSPDLSNLTYDGLEISANFFPQITNDNYLYFFSDASGIVYYNEYPSNTDLINPFTEPGGYILVVQRHYRDLSNNAVFTTYGQYISFIPTSATNPWPITDTDYPIIASNPNPYSSFEPLDQGGQQNLQFYWTLEIPNINYNEIIPFEDSSAVNVEKIQQEFRNRGKEAYITSYVTYDFGIENRPFVERYPLLRINGNPNYTTASQSYETNLCSTTVPLTEPEWPRFRPECIDATPEEKEAYQMRRKAETLFHKSNRNDIRVKKKNWYSFVSQGYNQKHQTYATQTDKFTNPNTKNYPILGGRNMTLPADCPRTTITAPSTSSDVPGPAVPLTYDPNVPLINYKVFRTYTNSETEYAEKNKN